jgi:hypothetical protein
MEVGRAAVPIQGPSSGSRLDEDIAELNIDVKQSPPGEQPTMDVVQPLQNDKPRYVAEARFFGCAVTYLADGIFIPEGLRQGFTWYTIFHSLLLVAMTVCTAALFIRNTHLKIMRLLISKKVFRMVAVLSLIDWVKALAFPYPGWEVVDEISSTTVLIIRLSFICLDSLKGVSSKFRRFLVVLFLLGNVFAIFSAYFMNEAQTIFVIADTNTTITTTAVKASVGTTMVTVTSVMAVGIFSDKDFQYSALYRSYLPKLAVDTAGVEPSSAEMLAILQAQKAATAVWTGWPRKSAVVKQR